MPIYGIYCFIKIIIFNSWIFRKMPGKTIGCKNVPNYQVQDNS